MQNSLNPRAIATQIITRVLRDGCSLSDVLSEFKQTYKNHQETGLIQALCFGVLRSYPRLAFITNKLLEKPIKQKEVDLLYLICVGLYQLMEMRIPDHAAISETVEAAKLLQKPWAAGLVNAVLRNYLRHKENLEEAIKTNLEAKSTHPLWLLKTFQKAWPERWESIIKANNEHPPLALRANLKQISREAFLKLLNEKNITAHPISYTPAGVSLEIAQDVTTLPGFKEGLFSVQDGASQWTAPLLDLSPGMRVLDACAAPGGKTSQILEQDSNLSELVSLDISKQRTELIKQNLKRLQLKATVLTGDACDPKSWWNGQLFDRILLDAPCSATGIIRRHPDIKYLRKPNDIANLTKQQLCLLETLWPLLKPNGILLYSTCSVLPEENQNVIQFFLNTHLNHQILPLNLPIGLPQSIGQQFLPGQNGMDGFYYAKIRKL